MDDNAMLDDALTPTGLALRACAGLRLPARVPEGAVKRLVEAAKVFVFRMSLGPLDWAAKQGPDYDPRPEDEEAANNLRAALREFGVEE